MNILQVVNSGNPGGMEQHILDLVKGMKKRGCEVFVWCNSGDVVDWYKKAGARVSEKKLRVEIDPLYILELVDFLKKNKIDVIHGHDLKGGTNALLAGFIARTPVRVSHIHTPMSEWQVPNFAKKLFTYFEIFGYSFLVNLAADTEIALTESRKEVKKKEGIANNKLTVIPNGLDLSKFDYSREEKLQNRKYIREKYGVSENKFVFGNVSRMTDEKGHELLVEAFAEFLKKVEEKDKYHLLLAGGGALEHQVRQKVKKTRVTGCDFKDKVSITGIFEAEDLPRFYNSFDIFVFPSLAEGFGIVLIEGMYSEVPIICSDLDVLQEVAKDTVTYFKKGQVTDLVAKMLSFSQNPKKYENQLTKAKERVQIKYTLEVFEKNYYNLYTNLLNKKKKS